MVATLGFGGASLAQEGVFQTKSLTPETALRREGCLWSFSEAGAIRLPSLSLIEQGLAQVYFATAFAGAHLLTSHPTSLDSASFRTPTAALAAETQAGKPMKWAA